jgi:Ca2+-binding RTX toxin-like protein
MTWCSAVSGDDTITVWNGNNRVGGDNGLITPDSGHDPGPAADDTIMTGSGDDIVIAGGGRDTVETDDGNDVLIGDNGAVLTANGALKLIGTDDPTFGDDDRLSSSGRQRHRLRWHRRPTSSRRAPATTSSSATSGYVLGAGSHRPATYSRRPRGSPGSAGSRSRPGV